MHYHDKTKHTYMSIRSGSRFINWDAQPQSFKSYPRWMHSIPLENKNEIEKFITFSASITMQRSYGNNVVSLRVNPSAGGLYPNELYLQIRSVTGFEDGIYHYEVEHNSLKMLHPLSDDGIEFYLQDKRIIKGIVFLISSPYFRSAWKYGDRSFRYVLLDSGHLLGAIEAASILLKRDIKISSDFLKKQLNADFNFEDKEFFTAVAISGSIGEKEISRGLREQIPFVLPTDYHVANEMVFGEYRNSLASEQHSKEPQSSKFKKFKDERLEKTILNRRSIRRFFAEKITKNELDFMLEFVTSETPINFDEKIDIYYIANRVEGLEKGLYKNGELIKKGDFEKDARYLCLEQDLGGESGATIFLTSKFFNYENAMMLAGFLGHRFYVASNYLEIGCSGIGAYYDDDVKKFIESDDAILYTLAVGR